jgi:multisubunit Na+/H+ antiporter MnhC subunit
MKNKLTLQTINLGIGIGILFILLFSDNSYKRIRSLCIVGLIINVVYLTYTKRKENQQKENDSL